MNALMKILKMYLVIAAVILSAAGCAGKSGGEITDRSGRKVSLNASVNRIVSAAPSNTEIIIDLGMADKLVAVDRYSAELPELPAGIAHIDFSYPDAEAIIDLEPDLIIANGHNVTVSGDDPFRLLKETGIPVAYISMSKTIDDIYKDILFVADLLSVKNKGDELIRSMKARIGEITEKTARAKMKRSVYLELSAAPEMFTFGKDSYINDMISVIGARNIFANDNWVLNPSAEAVIERNPDVILTAVDYLDDPVEELKNRYGFNHIGAVINKRIYRIDTNSLSRPSARIVTALDEMARAVYPELYE
jgi:iron complex transport system substrate-binding protein